ncbi:MAG: ABC transporter permease, partial [Actinomycetia bacterium]|nr:ABC transporter permease [Actinomycetes bacterium]
RREAGGPADRRRGREVPDGVGRGGRLGAGERRGLRSGALRLVRAETLAIKTEGYVEASRSLGTPVVKLVFKHIIPNLLGKVIVQCSITFALSVVIEASLSYLGLGTQPPTPSWGLMLKDARDYLVIAPWMAVYPGLAIALTVFCFNILGDTLSEKLNPRVYRQ